MLHHFATTDAQGLPVVAYASPQGGGVIVCECATPERAASEAARLNAQSYAMEQHSIRRALAPRRFIRYFEDDAFA
jgi:hypothetical protein